MGLAFDAVAAAAVILAIGAAIAYPAGNALQQRAHLSDLHVDAGACAATATAGVLRQSVW